MKILYSYFRAGEEATEILEAESIKTEHYKITQIPSEALGVSKGDELEAMVMADENLPEFIRFIQKSGNKTLKVLQFADLPSQNRILKKLNDEFCEYRWYQNQLVIHIPPIASLNEIKNFLITEHAIFQMMNPSPFEGNLYISL